MCPVILVCKLTQESILRTISGNPEKVGSCTFKSHNTRPEATRIINNETIARVPLHTD